MTYKCPEERIDLGLTKEVGEHLEAGVELQVERECREAETNVTQDIEIQTKDVFELYGQVNVGANVKEGSRILELAARDGILGEARRASGGAGEGERDKGECDDNERTEAVHGGRR